MGDGKSAGSVLLKVAKNKKTKKPEGEAMSERASASNSEWLDLGRPDQRGGGVPS